MSWVGTVTGKGPYEALMRHGKTTTVVWVEPYISKTGKLVSGWRCTRTLKIIQPKGFREISHEMDRR